MINSNGKLGYIFRRRELSQSTGVSSILNTGPEVSSLNMIHPGKHTYGSENIRIRHWGEDAKLKIGSFCSISDNVTIYLGGGHRTDWVTTYPFGHINKTIFNKFSGVGHPKTNGDVVIGNDVWIASNVTIMSGIKIGDGAVIAANSHVVKDVEPYSIVGGNPAKLIKYRFPQEQISKLLEICWWNWDDTRINNESSLLCNQDIQSFIDNNLLRSS